MNEFNSIAALAYQLYLIDMDQDEFEEIALNGWRLIGNMFYNTYCHVATIINHEVHLPCNFVVGESKIESVTTCTEDAYSTNLSPYDTVNAATEQEIEGMKSNSSFLYESGKFIDYEQDGTILRFKTTGITVKILYKGLLVDDDGLPYVSNKEMHALALYCAYVKSFKMALASKDQFLSQIAVAHKQNWDKACSNARTPDKLNQNAMDKILNAVTSWDRKRYGLSYKPTKR